MIDSDRGARSVQKLCAGEYVLAPLSEKLCPIQYTRKNSIFTELLSDWTAKYRPVVIPMGAIGSKIPYSSVIVSASQEILIAIRKPRIRYKVCEWVRASDLWTHGILTEEYPYPYIEYFEVALSEGAMIGVEGLILKSLSSDMAVINKKG
ncbi:MULTISPECIES: Hint domain-containing protein [Roseobacteraceae]|uniref:Hint domain-containing protein n=1 Tax=Roseobacteraceae TaxID=2854170 RepID=UPI0012FE3A41|nr:MULTISPECIES: Hint domain-containing protein [Roseobacteraceae]